jgi:hypothetical protein
MAAAKATSKGQIAAARLVRLDEAKADLETRKTEKRTEAPQGPRQADDPVEQYLSQFTERSQRWLRDHKEWISDPKKHARLLSAHHAAVADDYIADTDEYFKQVETILGMNKTAETNGASKPQQRRSPPVAPVNASGGAGSVSGGNEVRLSKREAEAATDGTLVWNYPDPTGQNRWKKGEPIGLQEAARRKLQMQKDGLYDRSFTDA